ncbi:MAG: HAD-IIA family hydrolase [Gammaproteobacteria bacterium]|nr:HAD-IIA family hydrolase [Gammaproteobacteria bacterium]
MNLNKISLDQQEIKAILLDMDGVLYHGYQALDHAIEFMESIQHFPHCFITNNPILLPHQIADKLEGLGFNRPNPDFIITSGEATALWLYEQQGTFRYFSVGAQGLNDALDQFGEFNDEQADYVIIGEGAGINYENISTGINLILKNKAQLISTNPDITVDGVIAGNHVTLPGGGALVAPFIAATGQQPITIGKPFPLLYQIAMKKLKIKAENCLMIGDRPDTDIIGAAKLGMKTALVRTGQFRAEQPLPKNCPQPNWDVLNLSQLHQALK